MIPLEKIKNIVDTYEKLEKELASVDISKENFVKKSKEYANIGEVINEARSYLNFEKEKTELDKMIEEFEEEKYRISHDEEGPEPDDTIH